MKYVLLIGDGMGDLPIPALDNKTPLEYAATPAMDRLAMEGEMLLVHTVPDGFPPGSDVANLSLLGYEPDKYYTGRAPLEAASMGVDLAGDEIAFRCNLVTLDHSADGSSVGMADYSAGHISTEEARELINAVAAECNTDRLAFHPGVSYRHLMVWKGSSPRLDPVPPHDYTDQDVTVFYKQYLAVPEFKELLEKANKILADHPVNKARVASGKNPANGLWLWGAGRKPKMEFIKDRYGVSGSLISAVDLLKGLGVCSGLEVVEVEGVTGYIDTNYEGKAEAALYALRDQDLVVVHVEAPDEAGHQGSTEDKVQAITDFDGRIVAPIVRGLEELGEPFRVVITMDHYTPISRKTHEDWPVPMVIYDSRGVDSPGGCGYTEANVKKVVQVNGLELQSGAQFFKRFISGSS